MVRIFPNRSAARQLIGAVLAEQHDEWDAHRYLTPRVAREAGRSAGGLTDTSCRGLSNNNRMTLSCTTCNDLSYTFQRTITFQLLAA